MDIRSVSGASANRPTVSPLPEAVAETGDPAASGSSSPATAEGKAVGAGGYISPFLRYDQGARVAVLLFRDVDTGETQDQIPSRRVVEEYRRTASRLSQPTGEGGTGGDGAVSASRAGAGDTVANAAANRGISFASFGASGSTASPANSGSGTIPGGAGGGFASGPTTVSGAVSGAASGATSGGTALPLAGAGGGAAPPGGLVSVTV